jgi:uncharacterized repeat protein (TIGR01451 family)
MIKQLPQRILRLVFTLIICLLAPISVLAQLKVTYPVNRMVIQRNSSNQATVQIAGSYSQPIELIEARAVVRATGQGVTTGWSTLQANPSNGQFGGTINVTGGWYRIQVRAWSGGTIVAMDSVSRFGVGEVFAIIGHSNAQGSSCYINGVDQCSTIGGANDDRVTVIAIDHSSSTFQQGYLQTADTRYLPGLAFSQLLTHSGSSPFAQDAWLWGRMGDALVSQINVPVLIYNAGFGGTTMQMNYWAAYDIPFQHSFVRYDLRMPYVNLRNLMNLYVPTTGIRAVLIQHGENDRNNPADSTYKYYTKVIDKARTEFNKPNLGCIIALSSFVGTPYTNVRQAQSQVINRSNYNAFLGPDLDSINTTADRPDGLHFSPSGQVNAGNRWAAAIARTWSSATPYLAETQPLASIACAGSNQLTLSQPSGYQYDWNTGSTNQSITVGAGTYSARIKNGQNRIYFPPDVVVPTSIQLPATPTLSSADGTWNICRNTGLTLISSYTGPNYWSTGATSSSIVVTTPGTYTLQAQHPVYNCLSSPVSQTIGRAPVDIGVSMVTSRHAIAVNDTVSFRMLVRNKSGCDAGSITVVSRLPPNVSVVSTSTQTTIANNMASSTLPALLAGATVSQSYTARLTASGIYRTTAELTATASPEVNATPNNGTANGEDDEAMADVRTQEFSETVYESPNPNQGALPAVQSNQPTPNSAKIDLSVQMQFNRQVVAVNQPVDLTLTVSNLGGLTATNVVVRDVLPAGMQFISSASGMSANGDVVSGTIGQLPAGQSVRLTFTAKVTSPGVFTNQAQIMSVDQTDTDSIPGNGYTNGEDDQSSLTLRTTG